MSYNISFIFANSEARNNAIITFSDIGKIAHQLDDNSYWQIINYLFAIGPVWKALPALPEPEVPEEAPPAPFPPPITTPTEDYDGYVLTWSSNDNKLVLLSSSGQTVTKIQNVPVSANHPIDGYTFVYDANDNEWKTDVRIDGANINANFGSQNIITTGTISGTITGTVIISALTVTGLGLGIAHISSGGVFSSSLIVNADIHSAAAIAGTKINPAFGAQAISTSSTLNVGAATTTALTVSTFGTGIVHSSVAGVFSSSLIVAADVTTGTLTTSLLAPGSNGQIIVTTAGVATWSSPGGDLSGNYPSPTVAKVNGATVPSSGALITGNGLYVTGVSALNYSALDLAGGSNYVTGILPAGNQAAQTMTGDVTGTTAASTVAKINATTITTAGGALTTGTVLCVTGAASADWGALDLANASAVTGALPIGNIAPSGTNGQALITTAGVAAWGTNFGAQNLTTTGYIALGTNPSTSIGDIRLPEGGSIYGRNAANTLNLQLLGWSAGVLTLGTTASFSRITLSSTGWGLFAASTLALNATTVQANFGVGYVVGFSAPGNGEFGNLMNASVGGAIRFHGANTNWTGIAANTGGTGTFSGGSCVGGTVSNTGGDAILVPGIATGTGPIQGTVRLQDGAAADQATVTAGAFNVNNVLTIGTTPATAIGHIRLPTGAVINARNAANTGNVSILQWGSDVTTVGNGSNSRATFSSTLFQMFANTTLVFTATTAQVTFGTGYVVGFSAPGNGTFGTLQNASVGGAIRYQGASTNWTGIADNTGGTGTFSGGSCVGGTVSNTGGDAIVVPGIATGTGPVQGTVRLQDGAAADQLKVTAGVVNIVNTLTFGTTPATAGGHIRLPTGGLINARNAANSADVNLLSWSADVLFVGAAANSLVRLSTLGTLVCSSTTVFQWGSASVTNISANLLQDNAIGNAIWGGLTVSTAGYTAPTLTIKGHSVSGTGNVVAGAVTVQAGSVTGVSPTNATAAALTLAGGDSLSAGSATNVGGDWIARPGRGTGTGAADGTLRLRDGASADQATVTSAGFNVTSVLTMNVAGAGAIARFGLAPGSGTGSAAASGLLRMAMSTAGEVILMATRINADSSDAQVLTWNAPTARLTLGETAINQIDVGGASSIVNLLGNTQVNLTTSGGQVLSALAAQILVRVPLIGVNQSFDFGIQAGASTGAGMKLRGLQITTTSGTNATTGLVSLVGGECTGVGATSNTGGPVDVRGGAASGAATNVGNTLTLAGGGATNGSTANTGGDVVIKGGLAQTGAGTQTQGIGRLQSSAATDVATWNATGLTLPTLPLIMGATPSATGTIRLASNNTIKARNAANSADRNLLSWNASDVLQIGDGSAAGVIIDAGGGNTVDLQVGNSSKILVGPTTITINSGSTMALNWAATVTAVSIGQLGNAAAGAAIDMKITAQGSQGGTSTDGGMLQLSGGRNAGAPNLGGGVMLNMTDATLTPPTNTMFEVGSVKTATRYAALFSVNRLTNTQMPANTGDLVLWVGDAATVPTADPTAGHIYYSDAGKPAWRWATTHRVRFDDTTATTTLTGAITLAPVLPLAHLTLKIDGVTTYVPFYTDITPSMQRTVQTTNATPTTIITYSGLSVNDVAVQVFVKITGLKNNFTEAAGYYLTGTFRRTGGTITQVGSTLMISQNEDTASWDATLAVSGTDILVQVTGVAATTINWQASIEVAKNI